MKKFCAVYGLFKNEYRFLPLWIKYYSGLFGMENLYILDHCSTDDSTKDLECNVEIVGEKVSFCSDHHWIYKTMLDKHVELLKEYKYVISVDADEFIFTTPKYENLKHYIETNNEKSVRRPGIRRCTGYEIIQQPDEQALKWNKPILIKQRNRWIRLNTYDKESIVSKVTNWSMGRHFTHNKKHDPPDGNLILCHLHRVDYEHCKEKYLFENDVEKLDKIFPIFTNKSLFDSYFVEPNYHRQFQAMATTLKKIPKGFENII